MTEQFVPAASIAGMVFSLLVCVGVPVALLIVLKKRTGASLISFFTGCAVFVIFALVLERLLHAFVLTRWAEVMQANMWLYAVYGGLAAGIFEETGRLVAMKTVLKKRLDKQNALMYGAGHGGIEAILIAGLAAVSNLSASLAINTGKLPEMLASADEATAAAITQLCTYPSGMFYLSGIERLIAMSLHIALSYIVYRAVRDKKPAYFALAVGIHFVVDAGTILLSSFASVYLLEAVLFVAVAVLAFFVARAYRREPAQDVTVCAAEATDAEAPTPEQ